MNFFIKTLDILFPKKCTGCQTVGSFLCPECIQSARPDGLFYEDCGIALDYRAPAVRSAIHLLKYKGRGSVALDLAKGAHFRFKDFLSEISERSGHADTIIIPIPLHSKRQKERGYNQSELIAKELVKILGVKNLQLQKDILKKIKATQTQVSTKNKTERTKNMKDCFEVNLKNTKNIQNIKNKNIVILDDIVTTGSTLNEAKKVLAKAGLKNIFLYALAH